MNNNNENFLYQLEELKNLKVDILREKFQVICEGIKVNQEEVYNFDSEDIKIGDIVFGAVLDLHSPDQPMQRFPFRIISKDYIYNTISLLGLRPTGKYEDTVNLKEAKESKWDVAFIINHKLVYLKDCSIMENEFASILLKSDYKNHVLLATGTPFWLSGDYENLAKCRVINSSGCSGNCTENFSAYAIPFVKIHNQLNSPYRYPF